MLKNRFSQLKPAHQAFILLFCVAILLSPISMALSGVVDTRFSTFVYCLLIAMVSAYGASVIKLQRWWRWILGVFPMAVWSLNQVTVPTYVFFILFVITATMYWSTNTTQVPFYPSRLPVWRQLLHLIPKKHRYRVIDIGSGLGDLAMYLAEKRPDCECEGIEIAPMPWFISYVRAKWRSSKAQFQLGNYHALNFAEYDVIFAYLSPAAMNALWQKCANEMRPGGLLVSYEFDIPEFPPQRKVRPTLHGPWLYIWEF